MKIADALAQATEHGWQDDTRWSRSTVAEQVSRITGNLLATVSLLADGKIRWSVTSLDNRQRSQRGDASSIDAAFTACEDTIAALTGTLF